MEVREKKMFALYGALFTVLWAVIYSYFWAEGKALLVGDGLNQHLMALCYWGKALRRAAYSLCHGRIEHIMWDWNIGYGADVMTTLHYYVIGDPLALFAAFVPVKGTYVLYHLLIFVRMMLCGGSFLVFCLYHKADKKAAVCGALVYAFCGFNLYCAVRHPYFANPLIYLPLLFVGIDRILTEKKAIMFAAMVFVSCASNFYFFYMMSIMVFIYAIVRYCFVVEEKNAKVLLNRVAISLVSYAIGVMMASAIFLPQIAGFLSSSRVSEDRNLSLFYRTNYYVKLLFSYVAPVSFDAYTLLGFAAPALPLLLCVIVQKDERAKQIRIFSLIIAVFLVFPYFGHVFNGFNYVSNRWIFCAALPASYAVVLGIPLIQKMTLRKMRFLLTFCLVMSAVVAASSFVSRGMRHDFLMFYILLAAFVLTVFAFQKLGKYQKASYALFLSAICVSIAVNGYLRYGRKFYGYIDDFLDAKSAKDAMAFVAGGKKGMGDADGGINRIDTAAYPAINAPAVMTDMGTTYYWAQTNDALFNFFGKFGLGDIMSLRTMERRTALESFLSVKYLYLKKGDVLPYGFVPMDTEGGMCKNTLALPFGFVYKDISSESDFLRLGPVEREDALLRYAILPDKEAGDNTEAMKPSKNVFLEECTFNPQGGMKRIDDNHFEADEAGAAWQLLCNSKHSGEVYVVIDNLRRIEGPRMQDDVEVSITDNLGTAKRRLGINPAKKSWGHDVVSSLGYHDAGKRDLSISFDKKGKYEADGIYVYTLSLDGYEELTAELGKNVLQNVRLGTNALLADITVGGSKQVLCMTIPYAAGWKAKLDGKDVPIVRVQFGFSGIILDRGEHTLSMKYSTPLFGVGMAATAAGWVMFIAAAVCALDRKRHGNKTQGKEGNIL